MIRGGFHFGRGDGSRPGCGGGGGFGWGGRTGHRRPRHRPVGGGTDRAAALPVSALAVIRAEVGLAVQVHSQNLSISGGIERRGEASEWFRNRRLGRAALPRHRTGKCWTASAGRSGVLSVRFPLCGHCWSGCGARLFLSGFLDRGGPVLGWFCWSLRSLSGLGGGGQRISFLPTFLIYGGL